MKKYMLLSAACAISLTAFTAEGSFGKFRPQNYIRYEVHPIGILDEDGEIRNSSSGIDLNNKGQVIGTSAFTSPGSPRSKVASFLWTKKDGIKMLDTGYRPVGEDGSSVHSIVRDINENGVIVGYNQYRNETPPRIAGYSSFIISENGEFADLPNLSDVPNRSGRPYTLAAGINDQLKIVGRAIVYNDQARPAERPAVLWRPYFGPSALNNLFGEGSLQYSSLANAINSKGYIVGDTTVPVDSDLDSDQACIWSPDGEITVIGTLDPNPNNQPRSTAFGINRRNHVVGQSEIHDEAGNIIAQNAFLWTSKGGISPLEKPEREVPDGSVLSTFAAAINNWGFIVGRSAVSTPRSPRGITHTEYRAVIWISGVAIDLNELVVGYDRVIAGAIAINSRGQILANALDGEGHITPLFLTPKFVSRFGRR